MGRPADENGFLLDFEADIGCTIEHAHAQPDGACYGCMVEEINSLRALASKGARPMNCKPCDRCGGLSQFAKPDDVARRRIEAEAIVSEVSKWPCRDDCGRGYVCKVGETIADESEMCLTCRARRWLETAK